MKIYSLKSKSLGFFNVPFVMSDDMSAVNAIRNAVINGNDISLLGNLKDLELYSLGEFDSAKGITKIKLVKVIDCADIPNIAEMAKEVLNRNEILQPNA